MQHGTRFKMVFQTDGQLKLCKTNLPCDDNKTCQK